MTTFVSQTTFVVEACCACHVEFAMTTAHRSQRLADRAAFYCPNGHSQAYTGPTDLTKARRRQRELEVRNQDLNDSLHAARHLAASERRTAAAYKGHLTRTRNRVAKGLCPQAGCKRSFTSLHDHVATCHPDLIAALDE